MTPDPLANAIAAVTALGRAQRARMIDQGAAVMLREPRRIMMALFPLHPKMWDAPRRPDVHLASARSLLATFPNAVGNMALECAVAALQRMIAAEREAA